MRRAGRHRSQCSNRCRPLYGPQSRSNAKLRGTEYCRAGEVTVARQQCSCQQVKYYRAGEVTVAKDATVPSISGYSGVKFYSKHRRNVLRVLTKADTTKNLTSSTSKDFHNLNSKPGSERDKLI